MEQLDLAIVGGEVVNADGVARADVGVADGRIAAVVAPGTPLDAARTLDAAGRHLLPGVIDPHVHMRSPGLTFAESLERETRSLIAGGVTSALVFLQAPTGPYAPVLEEAIAAVPERSYCDLGFSPIIESMEHVRELPELADRFGATSYKMYFATGGAGRELYPGTISIDDGIMFEALGTIAGMRAPAIAMAHTENWEIAQALERRLRDEGRRDPAAWADSRPNPLEEECVLRAAYYARVQGCPLYVVHVSTAEGRQAIRDARARGQHIHGETCPHLLMFHRDHPKAALAKYNPAPKSPADHEALWSALADGSLECMGSDHIAIRWADKSRFGFDDIWEAQGGAPGSATILPLLLSEGVNGGRLTLPQVAAVTSANAARIFGIPGKGRIAPGADADLVLVDLEREVELQPEMLQVDFSLFAGDRFRGWPVATVLRGEVVMEDGQILGAPGAGRYLRR